MLEKIRAQKKVEKVLALNFSDCAKYCCGVVGRTKRKWGWGEKVVSWAGQKKKKKIPPTPQKKRKGPPEGNPKRDTREVQERSTRLTFAVARDDSLVFFNHVRKRANTTPMPEIMAPMNQIISLGINGLA